MSIGMPRYVTAILLTVAVAFITIGGIQRIASVAEKVIPLMCILYIGGVVLILVSHITLLPSTLALIIKSAFTPQAVFGGGTGITISSQSGYRLQDLGPENNELLAVTPTEKLLQLDILQPSQIKNTLHAYQLAKRCNVKRVMAEAVLWGKRGARINSISPGIIVTPLAKDEFNGPRGDFYKNMISKCPAGRPGTPDEVAHIAELLLSEKGSFISGSDFLIDGGATASYFYGPLQPNK